MNRISASSINAALLLGALLVASPAQSAMTQQCQFNEVTFGIDGVVPAPADDCIGWDDAIGANPTAETDWVNAAWSPAFGGSSDFGDGAFEFMLKDEGSSASGSFGGVDFELSADINSTGGAYTLEWTDNDTGVLPATFDFVFLAKAGQGSGAFLFDDITLSDSPATGGGTFSIGFETCKNSNCTTPALSHLTMLIRTGDTPVPPDEVAETATLLLLGLSAPVLLLAPRRRRARAASNSSRPQA